MDFITNESGQKLSFTLSINDKSNRYLSILIHGTCSNKDLLFLPKLGVSLKYNTLRFDLEGNGLSSGEFVFGGFSREVENIRTVVNWARSENFRVIALIGHSKGANEVLMYASRYGDVPLIVPIAARLDMSILPNFVQPVLEKINQEGFATINLGQKEFKIDKEGVRERTQINMNKVIEKVKNWVCVIHGSEDTLTDIKDSEGIENGLGIYCLERNIINNANHFFTGFDENLCQVINNFFLKTVPLLELRRKI